MTPGVPSKDPTYTLLLAKEDFKFSCAHFTLFGADRAELLHGHNYQVQVELAGRRLDDEGLLIDFDAVKSTIRRACDHLDNRTLIPSESPHLQVIEEAGGVEVVYRGRRYRFPAEDVLLLPVVNTSIEVFSRMLWRQLTDQLELPRVEVLGVGVAETAGQSCWYRARVSS